MIFYSVLLDRCRFADDSLWITRLWNELVEIEIDRYPFLARIASRL